MRLLRVSLFTLAASFLLLLALFTSINSAYAAAPRAPMQVSDTGQITGTVTNQAGTPLPDIDVEACRAPAAEGCLEEVAMASTDASGHYTLTALIPGDWAVRFMDALNIFYAEEFYDNKVSYLSATAIPVAAGATVTGINAVLFPGSSITGTVTNSAGEPQPSIFVEACLWEGSGCLATLQGSSDTTGYYVISDLRNGNWRLHAIDWSFAYPETFYNQRSNLASADDVPVHDGITVTVDIELANYATLSGTVTDEHGAPLANISVAACMPSAYGCFESTPVSTDSAGFYTMPGLAEGNWRVHFWDQANLYVAEYYDDKPSLDAATDIAVARSAVIAGIDAALAPLGLTPFGSISGTLTAKDDPATLVTASVEAWRLDGATWQYVTDTPLSTGAYSVTNLISGTYRLRFLNVEPLYESQYYSNATTLATATDIVVSDGADVTGIDVAFARLGRVHGRVSDSHGFPLAQILVEACMETDPSCVDGRHANTDVTGAYSVDGMKPGSWRLRFSSPQLIQDQMYKNGTLIPVTRGSDTMLEDSVLLRTSAIYGTVTTGGVPLPEPNVVACAWTGTDCQRLVNGTSNDTGAYSVTGLTPGSWRVRFSKAEYVDQYYDEKSSWATATDLTIVADTDVISINADLISAAAFSVVVNPDQPLTATFNGKPGQYVAISIPAGAVDQSTVLTFTQVVTPPVGNEFFSLGGFVFQIAAAQHGQPLDSLVLYKPMVLTITYTDADVAEMNEDMLELYYFNTTTGAWSGDGITVISRNTAANQITVAVEHLTTFGLGVEKPRIYLPAIRQAQ